MAGNLSGTSGLGSTAVLAALTGGLSCANPEFSSATGVFAALALALWLVSRPSVVTRLRAPWPSLPTSRGIGLTVTASGWMVFLTLSAVPLGPRAALLGAGTLVLWWLDPSGNESAGGPDS